MGTGQRVRKATFLQFHSSIESTKLTLSFSVQEYIGHQLFYSGGCWWLSRSALEVEL